MLVLGNFCERTKWMNPCEGTKWMNPYLLHFSCLGINTTTRTRFHGNISYDQIERSKNLWKGDGVL